MLAAVPQKDASSLCRTMRTYRLGADPLAGVGGWSWGLFEPPPHPLAPCCPRPPLSPSISHHKNPAEVMFRSAKRVAVATSTGVQDPVPIRHGPHIPQPPGLCLRGGEPCPSPVPAQVQSHAWPGALHQLGQEGCFESPQPPCQPPQGNFHFQTPLKRSLFPLCFSLPLFFPPPFSSLSAKNTQPTREGELGPTVLQPLRIPPGAKGVCGDGMGLELPRWLGLRVNVWKHEHKSGLGQQEWQGMEDVGTGWRPLGCWQPALRAGEGLAGRCGVPGVIEILCATAADGGEKQPGANHSE